MLVTSPARTISLERNNLLMQFKEQIYEKNSDVSPGSIRKIKKSMGYVKMDSIICSTGNV